MKRFLLRGAVFLAFSGAAFFPLLRLAEIVWTRDVSANPPPNFPVLAQSPAGKFVIVPLRDAPSQSHLVLDIAEQDLPRINQDLTSRIAPSQPAQSYFKILQRQAGYTEVSLQVPTTRDFWSKSWYRIQNGAIYPQKITSYGPMMGMYVVPLSLLVGVFGLRLYDRMRGRRTPSPGP